MKNTLSDLRTNAWRFLLRHPVSCALFCFLFVAGAAAGTQIAPVVGLINTLASNLREYGVPFFYCALISVCVCGFTLSLLILAGIWLPAFMFWPIGILLRGALTGTALKLAFSFIPQSPAFWLIPLILIETLIMLPPLIRIAAISGELLGASLKHITGGPKAEPCYSYYIAPCLALIPAIMIQSIAAPVALYLFC